VHRKSHQKLGEALLEPQKKIIGHGDVFYLVSPNILMVSLMLWSYDHAVELKLNKVFSVYTVVSNILQHYIYCCIRSIRH